MKNRMRGFLGIPLPCPACSPALRGPAEASGGGRAAPPRMAEARAALRAEVAGWPEAERGRYGPLLARLTDEQAADVVRAGARAFGVIAGGRFGPLLAIFWPFLGSIPCFLSQKKNVWQ